MSMTENPWEQLENLLKGPAPSISSVNESNLEKTADELDALDQDTENNSGDDDSDD